MCGITGIYAYADGEAVNEQVMRRMLGSIRHRGPDDEGMHIAGGLGLGIRRLSIIDLEGGHQPIYNEDGSIVLVLTGELYSYRELREQLLRRGHTLQTASATEVIVHLYEELRQER